ncbi:MAG: NAD(+) diphosphatase [Rhodobacter sp.]|nr:NAD(+) diphosphatase [Paracoccaceae bacterium]MCC0077505.1 NAD(+) diphosphatase [Rhodobacter sp.]
MVETQHIARGEQYVTVFTFFQDCHTPRGIQQGETVRSEVVFSAEWDDRSAELRADQAAIAAMATDSETRILPMWRGRPLLAGDDRGHAGWVPPGHPVLELAAEPMIFLGRHDGHARFAADISAWTPEGVDEAALRSFFDPTEYWHPATPPDHAFGELRGVMTRLRPSDAAMASTARALMNWHRSHRFCSACGQPSAVAMAGWQRSCPSCGGQHFPRTDPVVIMLVKKGNKILLGRSPGWPEGMYSTLAGFVEPGEALEAAVRREVREETGVRVGAVRYLASQPWAYPNSLMLGFVAEAQTEAITLDHELEDAIWLTREEMVDVMAGLHPTVRRPRSGAIAHVLVSRWLSGDIA